MNYVERFFRRFFYFDIDAYFVFSETLRSDWMYTPSEVAIGDFSVTFKTVDNPGSDPELVALCLEVGYFGRTYSEVQNNLARSESMGDECTVAECVGRYIAMSWTFVGEHTFWPEFAAIPIDKENVGLLHLTYVMRSFRGNYLQRHLDTRRKIRLSELGFNKAICCVGVKNLSSVRNSMACNSEYKLMYHMVVEIPFFGRKNFFPKWNREVWRSCRLHASKWWPEGG